MKTTPFQQALKNELSRLELLSYEQTGQNSRILLWRQPNLTRQRFSLLHFFRFIF